MPTNITGHILKDALALCDSRLETLRRRFPEVLLAFETEPKRSPLSIHEEIIGIIQRASRLKLAQQLYNTQVIVDTGVDGKKPISRLLYELKEHSRLANLWKAASKETTDRWQTAETSRSADTIVAKRQVSVEFAAQQHEALTRLTRSVRSALATANATEIALPDGVLEAEDLSYKSPAVPN